MQSAEIEDFGLDFIQQPKEEQTPKPVTELIGDSRTIAEIQKALDEKPKMTKEEVKEQKKQQKNWQRKLVEVMQK